MSASPFGRALRVGAGSLAVLLAAGLGGEELLRQRAAREARSTAERLSAAGAQVASDWLEERRRITRLLVEPLQELLGDEARRGQARDALARLHRAFPQLRAAVVADGEGTIVVAADAWREGTRPDWLAEGSPREGVHWPPAAGAGGIVAREAMVAPVDLRPPAWLATLWEPDELAERLAAVVAGSPGAVAVLAGPDGTDRLRVPPMGPEPEGAQQASAAAGAEGLRLRAVLPGAGSHSPWPWAAALVGALVAAAASSLQSSRRVALDARAAAAIDRAARGEGGDGADLGRDLPTSARALAALRRVGAAEASRDEHLHSLREHLRGAVVLVTDSTARVELVVGDAPRVLGRPAVEIQGHPLRRLLTASGWETLAPILARAALQSGGAVAEVQVTREREAEIWIELTIAGREKPGGYVLLARDATEGHRLREQAERAEARYRALVDPLPDGLAVVRNGVIENANQALARLLGLSVEELVGGELRHHVAASDLLVIAEQLRRLPREGAVFDLELRRADALAPVVTQVTASPLDEGGAILVFRDQTARRESERALAIAHRRLEATLGASVDAIGVIEPAPGGDRVVFANRALAQLLQASPDEVVRLSEEQAASRLIARGVLPESFRAWLEDLRRHPGARRSERFDSPQEPRRTLEIHGAPLELPGGHGRVLSFRDVTAAVEAERRLRRDHDLVEARREILEGANRDLERINRDLKTRSQELDRVNRRLKQLDEMRQNLLANVSHELQTPLVSIRGYTEMVLKGKIGPVTGEQERGLSISLKNIDRLIGLIDNLLEFSRAEGGLGELHLSTFRLRELVSETLDLMRDTAARRSIRLQADYPGGDPVIRADRDRIGQVLVNLVGNAVKFNREGGEVVIEVGPSRRGFARVEVRDSGPGIPAEDLERIFERYVRVERPGGREVEGSGLGLSISRQILRLHGCTIRAASPSSGGAIFSFTLPLAREEDPPSSPSFRRRSTATPDIP